MSAGFCGFCGADWTDAAGAALPACECRRQAARAQRSDAGSPRRAVSNFERFAIGVGVLRLSPEAAADYVAGVKKAGEA